MEENWRRTGGELEEMIHLMAVEEIHQIHCFFEKDHGLGSKAVSHSVSYSVPTVM
jgi:hypothetical protein